MRIRFPARRFIDSSLGLFDADFYFFWCAPAFVLVTVLVEGVGVRWSMTRLDEPPGGHLESERGRVILTTTLRASRGSEIPALLSLGQAR